MRELEEELGVKAEEKDLIYCGDRKVIWDDVFFDKPFHDRQISRVFLLWLDLEEEAFCIDPEEVNHVRWMNFEKCYHAVENNLFKTCMDWLQ